ncbi:hypothetical protein RHMOL_Rhmol07G0017100 [Rhododendron molle]|uniref:Uncharacterized protein n=1 Tax=Rhododendron molle TaxID=49168 RepID=A0ACC0MXU0_RHOML|nr:hypothetical protein RHMOL_Rhmol07G0017100 [Rhododendron molle]
MNNNRPLRCDHPLAHHQPPPRSRSAKPPRLKTPNATGLLARRQATDPSSPSSSAATTETSPNPTSTT